MPVPSLTMMQINVAFLEAIFLSLSISLPAFSQGTLPLFLLLLSHLACPFHVGPITYQSVPKLKSPSESAPKSSDSE